MIIKRIIDGIFCVTNAIAAYLCARGFVELYFFRTIGNLTPWEYTLTGFYFIGMLFFAFMTFILASSTVEKKH